MLRIATSAIAIATALSGFAAPAAHAARFEQPAFSAGATAELTLVSGDDRNGHKKRRHGDDRHGDDNDDDGYDDEDGEDDDD